VSEFASAILENTEITCTGFDGLQAQKIARAAKESLEKGVPVQLKQIVPVV
jgi:myo-inositol 2-dehydrogenase / D-chiro-inositol 1-dehydrogenase